MRCWPTADGSPQDPFTGPRCGQPRLTNKWLGDVVLYASWWWDGLEGIATVAN